MRNLWPLPLIVLVAFGLRCHWTWETVFAEGFVRFGGADPWHHMRQVDYLVANFPERLVHDPYGLHPGGQTVGVAPLLDYLIAAVALVLGLGSPAQATVDTVGAYAPAVLGALVPVPVFFLGRRLAGAAAGWVAAALAAILPGQLLSRTVLGFTDHHVLEALLVPAAVLLLLRAVDRVWEDGGSFGDLRAGRRRALARPLRDGALAGLALFAYLASWVGGAIVLLAVLVWLVLQVQVDFVRGRSSDGLALVCVPMYGVALLFVSGLLADVSRSDVHVEALATSLAVAALLPACAAWLRSRRASRWMLPIATLLVAVGGLLIVHLIFPRFLAGVWSQLTWFQGKGVQVTVGEAQPLLHVGGRESWARAWTFFGSAVVYLPIGVALIAWRSLRDGRPADLLLCVWTLAMVFLTFGQNRFAYYLAVNVALVAGVLFGPLLGWAWRDRETSALRGLAQQVLLPLVVIGAVVGPALPDILASAVRTSGPDDDVVATLGWMRDHTPEPFGDAEAYLALNPRRRKDSPPSAYGVLAWWDVGYWITRIGRRVPIANPTQSGAGSAARTYLAETEEAALRILDRKTVRYVLVTSAMLDWNPFGGVSVFGQVRDLVEWDAGHDLEDFRAVYDVPVEGGGVERLTFFHEAYFRTLLYRLGVLEGMGFKPQGVVSVVELDAGRDAAQGVLAARGVRTFPTYEEARAFVASLPAGEARIVSDSALVSCTPLVPLTRFRRVHGSAGEFEFAPGASVPSVRVFEVLR